MSTLTKNQKITFDPKTFTENGTHYRITATVRHDDQCGNGHNSFSITGETYRKAKNGQWVWDSCGCIHDDIAKHFPKLAPFIKWHLTSADGPMHYIANTVYHATAIDKYQGKWYFYLETQLIRIVNKTERQEMEAKYPGNCKFEPYYNSLTKEPDLAAARRSAIWPNATLEQLTDKAQLTARLPALMADFQRDVESLGLIY
jgi:hypothetical protein|tara:strand:- start:79 stop:681 length:603 start_codon:yes stop_codon:yes gene_type:complete